MPPSRTARRTNRPHPAPVVEWPRGVRDSIPVRRSLRYRRVQLEFDAVHERYRREPLSLLAPLTSLLREREVEDAEDLLTMTAEVLRAFSSAGFREVDHWEARPGGWLPLPEPTHARIAEPVVHLLRALSDESWAPVGRARQFAARLSGAGHVRLDFVLRRVHRERTHALSVELYGPVTRAAVEDLVDRVHQQLPLERAVVGAVVLEVGVPNRARRS